MWAGEGPATGPPWADRIPSSTTLTRVQVENAVLLSQIWRCSNGGGALMLSSECRSLGGSQPESPASRVAAPSKQPVKFASSPVTWKPPPSRSGECRLSCSPPVVLLLDNTRRTWGCLLQEPDDVPLKTQQP